MMHFDRDSDKWLFNSSSRRNCGENNDCETLCRRSGQTLRCATTTFELEGIQKLVRLNFICLPSRFDFSFFYDDSELSHNDVKDELVVGTNYEKFRRIFKGKTFKGQKKKHFSDGIK